MAPKQKLVESERKMSLPFSIGDIVEVNEEKISTEPSLLNFLGLRGRVETMGLRWVKVLFEGPPRRFIISCDQLKKVEDKIFNDEII